VFEQYNKVQKAVLETTLSIIIRKELQATSMALIAKESKVSTGSIYHYFSSKEAIINELYTAIVTYNGQFVQEGLNREGTLRERFTWGWERVIEISRQYPEGFQFIEQYSFSPYIYEDVKKKAYNGGWCAPMNKLYAEAMEQKLFKEMDPRLLVQMHYGSIVYMLKSYLQGNSELSDAGIKQAIEVCWQGASKE
jgi:Transcriptional regulator